MNKYMAAKKQLAQFNPHLRRQIKLLTRNGVKSDVNYFFFELKVFLKF